MKQILCDLTDQARIISFIRFSSPLPLERVAVKILDKAHLDEQSHAPLASEISCMVQLAHPNIVRLYEVVETFKRLYLVMEYAGGGELFSRIATGGRMSDVESKLVFTQVLSAVKHMVSRSGESTVGLSVPVK